MIRDAKIGNDLASRHEDMPMTEFGKLLVFLGAVLAAAGIVLMLLGRAHLPGRLPGDFVYRGKNTTVYFPLATSLLLSVVLSVVLYLIGRWRR
jgi:phosphatidylglycerophosphate synthase